MAETAGMPDALKWKAMCNHRRNKETRFFFGLRTTRRFCRLDCTASIPVWDDTMFFDTAADAKEQGLSPCPHCRPDLEGADREEAFLDRICAELENEETWSVSMVETARKLGLTAPKLLQMFRAETGLSPSAYMDARRLKAAKDDLALTSEPVQVISERLGFAGISAFRAFFQAQAGVSIEAFRRGEGQIRFPSSSISGFGLVDTAIGRILITENGSAITGVRFLDILPDEMMRRLDNNRTPLVEKAIGELSAYFSGQSRGFDLPIYFEGTPFAQTVWELLLQIPYGHTRTYSQIAALAGKSGASRAVGAAANRNPLLLLVPCHRVVGSNGSLVGYAGGVDVKEKLLRLERMNAF